MRIRALFIILLAIPSFSLAAVVYDGDHVKIMECGKEHRNEKGELLPFAAGVSIYMNMDCDSCSVKFVFDVPDKAGPAYNIRIEYLGMSAREAKKVETIFSSYIFPHCISGSSTEGFKNEVHIYEK